MDELDAILSGWRGLSGSNRDAVLATVVHVTGSAYRRPGARLLLIPDGRRIGSVSGGCLEGEISRKAWWFTESGQPVLKIYDTSSDDDAVWEFGLGCNGIVQVLLERVLSPSTEAMLSFLDASRHTRHGVVVATVIRSDSGSTLEVGQRLLFRPGAPMQGELATSSVASHLQGHVTQAAKSRRSRLVHLEQNGDQGAQILVEWVGPPQDLVIFGAGHDAIPVVAAAKSLGWRVTVADGRPAYATRERFPTADHVVVMRPGRLLDGIVITPLTAVVMMTHNYPLDARLLPPVLACRPRYVGMLGPNKRAERLFEELAIRRPSSVHAPVGLDIGCDTPAAIALSIVAEVQAALNGKQGGKLNGKTGSLHAPVLETGRAVEMPSMAEHPSFCETTVGSHV
ncbi:MAG: XdhC family protein [Bryobacteraceae bacterium]